MLCKIFKLKIFLVICCLILLQVRGARLKGIGRIMGGEDENIENVPFIVQIYYQGTFLCGGALISKYSVITGANCVFNKAASLFTVKAGASTLFDIGIQSKISKYMYPGAYKKRTADMDIAVLQLKTPLEGEFIKPIDLCKKGSIDEGDLVQIYGWGARTLAGGVTNQLQKAELTVVDNAKCQDDFSFTKVITESMFCATAPKKASCLSDLGGPVVIDNQLCGVISSLPGCNNNNVPSVFTNVLEMNKFIENAKEGGLIHISIT